MNITLDFYNCLQKPINDSIEGKISSLTLLRGETNSFLIGIRCDRSYVGVKAKIKGLPKRCYRVRTVHYVESQFVENDPADDYFIHNKKCLVPDILYDLPIPNFPINKDNLTLLWVDVCVDDEKYCKKNKLSFELSTSRDEFLVKNTLDILVKKTSLTDTDLAVTLWMSYDSLAKIYDTKPFTKKFYKILDNYLKNYAKHGNNMIYVPLFTPALDTDIGGERMTIQLVDVYKNKNAYRFNFEKLKFFINFCKTRGITYFEMCHLFTQWGAKNCPKIEVIEDDKKHNEFGWNVASDSKEYRDFLSQFLPELIKVIDDLGIRNNVFFHISDEPGDDTIEMYKSHKDFLTKYIGDFKVMDALSNFEYSNIVDMPVVALNHIEKFLDSKKDFFVYYCCATQTKYVSNRFVDMPSLRNQILGFQLYLNNAKGFLQWGYNYYFTYLSRAVINPYLSLTGWGLYNPGDTFIVYPGFDRKPIDSIRNEIYLHALNDYRLCKTVEKYCSANEVKSILKKYGMNNFYEYSHDDDTYFQLRNELLSLLK